MDCETAFCPLDCGRSDSSLWPKETGSWRFFALGILFLEEASCRVGSRLSWNCQAVRKSMLCVAKLRLGGWRGALPSRTSCSSFPIQGMRHMKKCLGHARPQQTWPGEQWDTQLATETETSDVWPVSPCPALWIDRSWAWSFLVCHVHILSQDITGIVKWRWFDTAELERGLFSNKQKLRPTISLTMNFGFVNYVCLLLTSRGAFL